MDANYNPSFRQDRRNVVRSTSSGAGGAFWGILAGVFFVFWPSILHVKASVAVSWYTILGGLVLLILVMAAMDAKPKQGIKLPPPPPPRMPDLRESDVFDGIR